MNELSLVQREIEIVRAHILDARLEIPLSGERRNVWYLLWLRGEQERLLNEIWRGKRGLHGSV